MASVHAFVDDRVLALSLEAAAAALGEDLASGLVLKEDRLRADLAKRTIGVVERERHVEVPGFQGVGPVDIVMSDLSGGQRSGLVECKWSVDLKRDKIYEGAWMRSGSDPIPSSPRRSAKPGLISTCQT
jgi:hypothetical protein